MSEESNQSSVQCSQCGKPAVFWIGDHSLCIDCNYKLRQSQYMQFSQNAAMQNMFDREIANMAGMPHLANPITIPPAPIPPINYNNQSVTVNGGTVGVINLGNVHEIQVSLQAMTQNGEVGVAEALTSLTNSVLAENNVAENDKNDLLEQLAFLTAQAAMPPAERKSGMIKQVISSVKAASGVVTSVAGAWKVVEPILHGHFGL